MPAIVAAPKPRRARSTPQRRATPTRRAPQSTSALRPWEAAAVYMLLSGVLFYATYGFANWAAAQRAYVPSAAFAWERAIPFLAWTIVPYWSLNLLYAASFFVCRTREELDRHWRRLLIAQAISIAAFLAFPLRFGFERPAIDGLGEGLYEALFAALGSFDQPFNQAPSLHVSLAVIVGARWMAHTSGWVRRALPAWFLLIGVSALTTYQHHFIDLPLGLWVGLFCLVLVPARREDNIRQSPAFMLAAAYLSGASLLVWLGWWIGGTGLWLWWPAGSCAIVGAAYFTGSPGLLRKHTVAGRLLLAPYLAAVRVNAWLWLRGRGEAREIAPGVWVGPASCDRSRFRSLVDVTAEVPFDAGAARYAHVPCLDLTPLSGGQLRRAGEAIAAFAAHRPTLVCCALGVQRSVAAAEAWRSGRYIGARECGVAQKLVAGSLVLTAKVVVGAKAHWVGCGPSDAPRIYIANHTSHADFVVLWSALPPELRDRTHPVAAAEYWQSNAIRRYLAERVFESVLVDRQHLLRNMDSMQSMSEALAQGKSLIVFPEGTRGRGDEVAPFKNGIWHLARHNPEIEIVPVWLSNLHRVLPRGAVAPKPYRASATFGVPLHLQPAELREAFLSRAREALIATQQL